MSDKPNSDQEPPRPPDAGCYPPVAEHFEILAKAALCFPRDRADPIGVFDALQRITETAGGEERRRELIIEWRRRKQEFPWYLPDSA